jgi:hypothetical protein
MDTTKSSAPPPTTRELRGLALYRDHGAEIKHIGHGVYEVPGCSGGTYEVDLAVFDGEETCSCPDHARRPGYSCKHLAAATIFRAKARAKARREQHQRTASRAAHASLAPLVAAL